jgi:PAS domain S-box-containing protein
VRLTAERQALAGFAAGLAVLGSLLYVAYRSTSALVEEGRLISRANEVLAAIEEIRAGILETAGDSRGYVLTGSERFLVQFEAAEAAIDGKLRRLGRLRDGSPRQGRRVQTLRTQSDENVSWHRHVIETRRRDGMDAALRLVATGKGESLMAGIRSTLAETASEEHERLAARVRQSEAGGRRALVTLGLLGAGSLAVLAAAHAAMRRSLRVRSLAEAETRRSLEQVRDLCDHAPCGYHSLDADGLIVDMNATELRWLGYDRDELIGKRTYRDLLAPGSLRSFDEHFPRFKERGWVRDLELDLLRKDETVLPVLVSATATKDASGRFLRSRSTVFDRTDREAADEERDRFFTLSLDLLCIADFDGRFRRLSPAWERTLGWTAEELMARPFISFVHPDDRERTADAMKGLVAGLPVFNFENRYQCRDGSYRWLQWSSIPALGPRLIYANARDVTEKRRADEDVRRARDAAEAAVRELDAFSYSVSHDLRAPLRSVDGFSQALLEDCADRLDEQGREHLRRIRTAAVRMGRLIDDLLNLSRVSRQQLGRETVDLSALARGIAEELRKSGPDRKAVFEIQEGALAEGDPGLLKVALENLLGNAWRFTSRKPGARIEFGTAQLDGGPAYFVRDDGAGFDMAYADKLFGAFQRLHSGREFEGTGIGLATVARIIRRHGGDVWAEGAVDRGATFYFTLGTGGTG